MQIDVKTHGSMQWKEWILQQSDYAIQHTNVRAVLRAPNIHVCGWIICRQRSAIESRMKTCNKSSKSTCNALTLHSGDTMPQCNVNGLQIGWCCQRASHFFREGRASREIKLRYKKFTDATVSMVSGHRILQKRPKAQAVAKLWWCAPPQGHVDQVCHQLHDGSCPKLHAAHWLPIPQRNHRKVERLHTIRTATKQRFHEKGQQCCPVRLLMAGENPRNGKWYPPVEQLQTEVRQLSWPGHKPFSGARTRIHGPKGADRLGSRPLSRFHSAAARYPLGVPTKPAKNVTAWAIISVERLLKVVKEPAGIATPELDMKTKVQNPSEWKTTDITSVRRCCMKVAPFLT